MAIQRAESESPDQIPPNFKALMSTKTYGHETGLSCAFRQHRAESHCKYIHGYALAVKFTFAAIDTDKCGWVVDFGGLKGLKEILANSFDHRLLVAEDDPLKNVLLALHDEGAAQVHIVPATGCEAFARMIFEVATQWLLDAGFSPRVWLHSVEVSEHGANSAICFG